MEDTTTQPSKHLNTSDSPVACSKHVQKETGIEETAAASSFEASSALLDEKDTLDPPAQKEYYPSFVLGSNSDGNNADYLNSKYSSKSLTADSRSLDLNPMLRGTSDHRLRNISALSSRSVSKVSFRSLLLTSPEQEHVTVMDFVHSEEPEGVEDQRELPPDSRISLAGVDCTLPMTWDNDRFFKDDGGYRELLNDALINMEELVQANDLWDEANKETGFLGTIWRWWIRICMCLTCDTVNCLKISRGLEESLYFQSAYESFVLSSLIREFDATNRLDVDSFALRLAFRNRNVSRILVRQLMARWDWVWHLHTQIAYSRWFDFFGRLPFLGFLAFPLTENFPHSRTSFRTAMGFYLGIMTWLKQCCRQSASPLRAVINLSEEDDYAEEQRRLYGTFNGREAANTFRIEHRLPTDESILWKFMKSPASTMINYGVEHVLCSLAKHWKNMVFQENGNFSHNRLELLHPFELLRFHMPIVLSTLANLRGRTCWDIEVLAPFVARLQQLDPSKVKKKSGDMERGVDNEIRAPCLAAQAIIEDLKIKIAPFVCAGIAARLEPFHQWLASIGASFEILANEAQIVRDFASSVETGASLGYQLLKLVSWRVPDDHHLAEAILAHCMGRNKYTENIPRSAVLSAMQRLDPKDLSTLEQLLVQKNRNFRAPVMLLSRTVKLLARELHRVATDEKVRSLSKGRFITKDELVGGHWYWINIDGNLTTVMFSSKDDQRNRFKFIRVETHQPLTCTSNDIASLREYIPIAEAIARAQKAFMTIEVEHCKRFSYSAFMEFGYAYTGNSLRNSLRRLATVSQIHCSEIDKARLNTLAEMRHSIDLIRESELATNGFLVCKPQDMIIIGKSPTGLLFALHCLQNVVFSGGRIKIYEGQDALEREVSPLETAQIARLDVRWVAMLRFHLGTSFEDVFVPLKGETDALFGNVLPVEGFIEITMKRLEHMLFNEVTSFCSKHLLKYFTGSAILFSAEHGTVQKKGRSIEINDVLFDRLDNNVLKVKDFIYPSKLSPEYLIEGEDYIIFRAGTKMGIPSRLVQVDYDLKLFKFAPFDEGMGEIAGTFDQLPLVYKDGQPRIGEPASVLVEENGTEKILDYESIAEKTFCLDVSSCHVIIALRKPLKMSSYFQVTSDEPYATCSVEGVKISLGMHLFGLLVKAIVQRMLFKLQRDASWIMQAQLLLGLESHSLHENLVREMDFFANGDFTRKRLQARWFEAGDNCHVGMELPREFVHWKNYISDIIFGRGISIDINARTSVYQEVDSFFDRLWFEASMEVISKGEAYDARGKPILPRFYTIDGPDLLKLGNIHRYDAFSLWKENAYYVIMQDTSLCQTTIKVTSKKLGDETTLVIPSSMNVIIVRNQCKSVLGSLDSGEAFEPVETFELIEKKRNHSLARNSSGSTFPLQNSTGINRRSDLEKGHDGDSQSKIALASVAVAHSVHHRTFKINRCFETNENASFITAFVGIAQVSPHFMRFHALTGGSVNCVSFNNFVAQTFRGTKFEDRVHRYSFETTWSNGEVVNRGTGHNYGEDGFLRPGFPFPSLIDFLFDRASEYFEMGIPPINSLLTKDWRAKISSALVPRGLETDLLFYDALLGEIEECIRQKFKSEFYLAIGDDDLGGSEPNLIDHVILEALLELTKQWRNNAAATTKVTENQLRDKHRKLFQEIALKMHMVVETLLSTLRFSIELRLKNDCNSSEHSKQLKPLDRIVHDDGMGAQSLVNLTVWSLSLATFTVALSLPPSLFTSFASFVVALCASSVSLKIMSKASYYRNRNAALQRIVIKTQLPKSVMTPDQRLRFELKGNPFLATVDELIEKFLRDCRYYQADLESVNSFKFAYNTFKNSSMTRSDTIMFMHQIIQQFIASRFHANSYLQEDLVNVCEEFDKILLLSRSVPGVQITGADELYRLLLDFRDKIQNTCAEKKVSVDIKSPSTKLAKTLFKTAEDVLADNKHAGEIPYAICDLRDIFYSTKERTFSFVVFVYAAIAHGFGIFFGALQLINSAWPREENRSAWGWVTVGLQILSLISLLFVIVALIACCILARRVGRLFFLMRHMHARFRNNVSVPVYLSITLTILQLIGLLAALVALPLSALMLNNEAKKGDLPTYPVFVAACSVLSLFLASGISWYTEFKVRYNFDPCVIPQICQEFIEQIVAERSLFSNPSHVDTNNSQQLDKLAREYAARQFLYKYRLDLLFPADRVGAIFHYLQSNEI